MSGGVHDGHLHLRLHLRRREPKGDDIGVCDGSPTREMAHETNHGSDLEVTMTGATVVSTAFAGCAGHGERSGFDTSGSGCLISNDPTTKFAGAGITTTAPVIAPPAVS
jgi:hypothetical protein